MTTIKRPWLIASIGLVLCSTLLARAETVQAQQAPALPGPNAKPQVIQIVRLSTVAAAARSYRDPELKEQAAYKLGEPVRLYVETANLVPVFATKLDGSLEMKGSMSFDLELRNTAGAIVKSGKNVLRTPVVQPISSEQKQLFASGKLRWTQLYANINLDPKLPPGTYSGTLRVHDDNCAGCSADARFNLTIAPGN